MEMRHHGKYRRSNPIKYHRVDLGAADDDDFAEEDDESILDRELRSSRSSKGNCDPGRYCRSFLIIFTILFTLVGLTLVVFYTAVILPESVGIKRGVFNFLHGPNATTSATNETIVGSTTIAPGENVRSTTAEKGKMSTVKNKASKSIAKPTRAMSIQKEIKKRNNGIKKEKGAPSIVESRNYVKWFQNVLNTFDDSVEISNGEKSPKPPTMNTSTATMKSEERTTVKQNSTEDGTTETLTITTTTSPNQATTTTNLNGATTTTNLNEATTITNLNQATTTYSTEAPNNQEPNWTQSFKEQYNDNFAVFVILISLSCFMFGGLILFCVLRRIRQKRLAKKRHFTRLVNDLNASEKFTLVTPSDEESE